ncbi:mechanosensitive ion channel family protein [Acetohalobium arabaticum]|uniref:MscS Mechanosensitive ion channel n=1 Tax=Acetohalobium arabaticum (strain ATCC 49924 / DSM 5501 / Z-7288) TaxID=574087 RepID=D9QQX4_ACEAZ|nr:mechanosensitive ion channel domain-containing protein [Acetohalobium arabaticum]ADL12915.1 MscS Mechanosensitive ion channel [Acetohalobium arabaticum DSM 5501]
MSSDLINEVTNQLIKMGNRYILLPKNIIQIGIMLIIFTLTLLTNKKVTSQIKSIVKNIFERSEVEFDEKVEALIEKLTFPITYTILFGLYILFGINFSWPYQIVNIAVEITTAWIIIRFMSSFFKNTLLIRLFSFLILSIAILNIMNIYDSTINLLDDIALSTGEIRISLLLIIQGFFLLSIFMWIATKITSFIEKKINNSKNLTPSLQVLINKFSRFTIFGFAILISLSSLGIDLTALTVLSGAIGVGIGFGLQKIVSNFISGIIILIDKSVKPGDVIEIDNTYGLISSLNSRFVSIVTLNGEEYLIPNEDFITKKVVNLSYSNKLIRLEVPVGISYNSNVEEAMKLIEEVANKNDRITNLQNPSCLLTGFGDSSINLKLKFWITDPEQGLENIKSQVLLGIWKTFQEHDIEIPYPQYELHLSSVKRESTETSFSFQKKESI